ncbi:uncharacterized serine-rich protein C215.13 [Carica papaya]|uniref:uncharacterized serine-rich protein C215.13 n=1 Tax=Carica papaya TaxID=3649 RepID=UPI000B8C7B6B|nr:uncharacterized serine-rich protein C215.13 [Carica papaya]
MPSSFGTNSSPNTITSHHQQSHQTKKLDEKFFSRLVTKENSRANSSSRVYYSGSVSVPFMWESQPGTPKHSLFSDTVLLPPLTPPPSYYNSKSIQKQSINKQTLLASLFSKLIATLKIKNPNNTTLSSTSFSYSTSSFSSSSSSSSSSYYSYQSSGSKNNSGKVANRESCRRPRRVPSCPGLRFNHGDGQDRRKEHDTTLCFHGRRRSGSMKNNAVFSIVGHE